MDSFPRHFLGESEEALHFTAITPALCKHDTALHFLAISGVSKQFNTLDSKYT